MGFKSLASQVFPGPFISLTSKTNKGGLKMEKIRKIITVLTLVVAFCLVLVSLVQAEEKAKSLTWVDHKPNPRFGIYDPGTPTQEGDDLVLDKKTGLVWPRTANLAGEMLTWEDATNYCQDLALGNLKGWRLPTQKELSSLIDPSQSSPALPKGHPFVIVKYTYWSGTTHEDLSDFAYYVEFAEGIMGAFTKIHKFYVWPVLEK
jgi:hypothetical protein